MNNPVSVHFRDSIAVVKIDNPPVNATGLAVRVGLLDAVQACEQACVKAAVVFCEGRTFVAGGDISEFGQPPTEPHLPDVYQAIEDSSVPWIAAMHGTVLGGGFELALVCAFRLAQTGTQFGLPEVNVGLIPGAGGSQRLPRLIGIEASVPLVTKGVMIGADELMRLGGLDRVFDGDPLTAGLIFSRSLPLRPVSVRQRDMAPLADGYFDETRAKTAAKSKGQKSPLHNLDALEWAATLPFSQGQTKERALHLKLRDTAESRALRHAFFAERQVSKPDVISGIKPRKINVVVVVGGGLMGAGIAFACLQAGLHVTLIERDVTAAQAGHERITGLIAGGVKRGKLSEAQAMEIAARLSSSADYVDATGADLAIEAVFEDMAVKQAVFHSLATHMDKNAILATNTSYLDPTEIMAGIANQARCIGLHFFSPAHIMKLLEIIRLPDTSAEVLATGFTLGKRLRKIGVLSGICDGFIGNRILAAYRRQADYLLMDGAVPVGIDTAMKSFGMPMGPYGLQDLTGLQIGWANRKRQAATRDPNERYVKIGDRLCEANRLGQRSGAGWYRYQEGSRTPMPDPFVTELIEELSAEAGIIRNEITAAEISDRILAVIINEGALILEEGIAERPLDVDMVMIHGYGFPRWRGGPMHYADETGLDRVRVALDAVQAQSPGSWRRSKLLS
ncbi:MAG: FAD-dependent oxidoreductase [Rhodobacteraceae bacterium]|nr:FAD-dependent oxidoreductase [Paracoccaceae bacterium]